jgi:hypothetical protein
VWEGFTTGAPAAPTTNRREYEPETGFILQDAEPIRYWPEGPKGAMPVGKTLAENRTQYEKKINQPCGTVKLMLLRDEGRCKAWALALINALNIDGLRANLVEITPPPTLNGALLTINAPRPKLLVKNWDFKEGGPASQGKIIREGGAVAQGVANPWAYFVDHVIVSAQIGEANVALNRLLYDPSYATGPIRYKAKSASAFSTALREFQESSMAGFCGTVRLVVRGPFTDRCEKAQAGVPRINGVVVGG